jgi:chaperonin GroES
LPEVVSVTWPRMPADPHDEVKHSIRMTADRLLLDPSPEAGDRKSRSGILIPATANVDRRLVWAEVVAAGPTVRTIEVADRVLFSPDTGFEVEIRGEEYLILRERDVHAIASTRAEGQSGLYL